MKLHMYVRNKVTSVIVQNFITLHHLFSNQTTLTVYDHTVF